VYIPGGNETFKQIDLDMMRLAAIYTVERLKPRLMPYFLMLLSKHGGLGRLKSAFLTRCVAVMQRIGRHVEASVN